MGVWLGPISGKFKKSSDYIFTGSHEFYSDTAGNWEIALKSSGNFLFKKTPGAIDIFLVGGGGKGQDGYGTNSGATANGGSGGSGGQVKTISNIEVTRNTNYSIIIGASDQDTTGFGQRAIGAGGIAGGYGSYSTLGGGGRSGAAGTNGSLAFGEPNTLAGKNIFFGASGGGAASARTDDYAGQDPKDGGATGGGRGGAASAYSGGSASSGSSGQINTGAGGGGGGAVVYKGQYYVYGASGGLGGSGIIIIRNHRS